MIEQFTRTAMLFGESAMARLFSARVAVFGVGGVGGHCAEALARTGIGSIDVFDADRVCPTNINRQIVAVHSTVGEYKVDAMKRRMLDINPNADIGAYKIFYGPETADGIDLSRYDYIADAVDTMTAKLELVTRAAALGVPIICSMGAANKLDPTAFKTADIYDTAVCPMARIMRRELRKHGIKSLKVVYSEEPAATPVEDLEDDERRGVTKRRIPASNAFVPPVAGLILAGEIIKDISALTRDDA